MELRNALMRLRSELGVTQTELANALHVNVTTVSRWELGKSSPNPSLSAALLEYARAASPACRSKLKQAVCSLAKHKLDVPRCVLCAPEHSTLRQLIDDASFPIYVCDLQTNELLYLNRKTEELAGGSREQLLGRKCYECLLHRDAPCASCHKERLATDHFVSFDMFRPEENAFYRIQGKLISWNGRKAQVRYITDAANSISLTVQRERQVSYSEQLRIRREIARDAIATTHCNLTHDTVTEATCQREDIRQYIQTHSVEEGLTALRGSVFLEAERRKLDGVCSREALIQQFYAGKTHISIRHCIPQTNGYYKSAFDLMQNPVTYDIEAFIALWDITDATREEDIVDKLLSIDYETVTTIDAQTGEARPYLGRYLDRVITEQKAAGDNVAGVEAYLRKYCADDDVERVIQGTSLPYVKEQLETKSFHHLTYSIRQNERIIYKRVVYTYLDNRRSLILCAMQDLTDLHELENVKRNQLADALQTLQKQAGMDIARYDLKTMTMYGSSQRAKDFGFDSAVPNVPEIFIEKGLIAPAYVETYREFFARLRAGEPCSVTIAGKVASGGLQWFRLNGKPILDGDGRPYLAIISFKNINGERQQAAFSSKWRQALTRRAPEEYSLYRCNLSKGTTYGTVEGSLVSPERLNPALRTFNSISRDYAGRFVHLDDFDAYVALLNSENLLADYYLGAYTAVIEYRERVTGEEYRWVRLTVETAQYPDSSDVEAYLVYEAMEREPIADKGADSQTMVEDAGVAVVTFTPAAGRFVYHPHLSRHMLGTFDSRPIWEIFMSDGVADARDVKLLKELVNGLAQTPSRTSGAMELTLKTPSGIAHRFNLYAFKEACQHDDSITLLFLDINEDVLAQKKLRFQAERDGLTGLYNRAAFLRLVTEAVCTRPPNAYLLLCGDINDFGLFNEHYGREEGDRLLQYAAEQLRVMSHSKKGVAGRLSNDVFALLLPFAPDALRKATDAIHRFFAGYPVKVTARAGACVISDPTLKADTLLDMAAMAKDSIKGKYDTWLAVYDDSMSESRLLEKSITDRMETALLDGQFDVYMQPQFHHGTGQVVGVEALVRWNDPERGVVPPGEFIPIFEKNGFITRMDEYVWEKAAQHVSRWMKNGHEPVPVSVNVSREDLTDPELCRKLLAIVEKYHIPTYIYRLEITESLFAENPKRLTAVVEELHKAGFLVEMDDFGSGYSSLNILKDVPVDILKLDMKFFSGDDNLGRGGMILNAVMRMSRWLGIPVIAEGVEVKEQADFLLSIGCPTVQGYLYERPMPAADFDNVLLAGGVKQVVPENTVETGLDAHSFWNPVSADSQVFNHFIGPAAVFEYHAGQYEIVRMNKRFIEAIGINETVMLPTDGLLHFQPEAQPKLKKAVLETIYTNKDVKVALRCALDDGSTPLFRATLRTIAKSEDRALIFAVLEA